MERQTVIAAYGDPAVPTSDVFKHWWENTEMWAQSLSVPVNEISGRFRTKPKGLVGNNACNTSAVCGDLCW